jgi:GTP-binding protein YchF
MKQVGILGLPGSGKTTVFQILTQGAGVSAQGPTGRDHVGVVRVPDERVDRLSAIYRPKKTTYTQIQFVESGAAGHGTKPGKGTDLFAGVRNCDALMAVVRDFENPAVPIEGGVDPDRDLSSLETELLINDLAIVETRIERIEKELKIGKKQGEREHQVLVRVRAALEQEHPLRTQRFDPEEEKILRGFQLLTRKPLLLVVNRDEGSRREPPPPEPGRLALALRAHLEREIVALPPAERDAFRAELGVLEDGLTLVIRACYELLGLISFFTVGPDEVRAWPLQGGEKAVDAAGEIHTDLARGFIRAEVIGWRELLELGGTAEARAKGTLRVEGRDYVVQDGDCMEIRFSR